MYYICIQLHYSFFKESNYLYCKVYFSFRVEIKIHNMVLDFRYVYLVRRI